MILVFYLKQLFYLGHSGGGNVDYILRQVLGDYERDVIRIGSGRFTRGDHESYRFGEIMNKERI